MKTKYFAFAALATMLASCSNDEDFVPQDNLKDTPITVTAGVAALTTRAGHDNNNLPETFYISIDQTGSNYDYTNVKMTKNSSTNAYESETPLLWAGGTETLTVTAATYPLDGASLAVETDQSTEDNLKASDHLYYYNEEVTPSENGISVEFSHIMSKVMLTIKLGDEFNESNNPITGVTFCGTKASIADDAAVADITPLAGAYTVPTTDAPNATAEYEVILVPQTVAADGFTVQFNVGERVFAWTSPSAVTLEKGTQYTLDLTAGKDIVSSATFSSSAWGAGTGNTVETE